MGERGNDLVVGPLRRCGLDGGGRAGMVQRGGIGWL